MTLYLCLWASIISAAPTSEAAPPMRESMVAKIATATIHELPDSDSVVLGLLEHGSMYKAVEEQHGWFRLLTGGWVPQAAVVLRKDAIAHFTQRLRADPGPFELCSRGAMFYYEGNERLALSDLNRALAIDPNYDEALCMRAAAYIQLNKYAEARSDLERAVKQIPTLSTAYKYLGNLEVRQGNLVAAMMAYDAAVLHSPTRSSYYLNRAKLVLLRKDQAGINDVEKAISLDDRDGEAFYCRALYQEFIGSPQQALKDIDKAIELRSDYLEAMDLKVRVLYQQQRFAEAADTCNRILSIDGDHIDGLAMRGYLLAANRKYDLALDEFARLRQKAPNAPEGLIGTAWLKAVCADARYRDGTAAVSDAQQANELSEWRNSTHVAILAAAYAESGNFESAIRYQKLSLKLLEEAELDLFLPIAKRWLKSYEDRKPLRQWVLCWR